MIFKQKKKTRHITLLSGQAVLFDGPLPEIPLREELILKTSTHFFNDPNPCYIHRGAVRIRLTAELESSLLSADPDLALLEDYTGLTGIDMVCIDGVQIQKESSDH